MKCVYIFTALTFDKGSVARASPRPLPQFNHYKWECKGFLFTNDPSRVGTIQGWNIVEIDKEISEKYYTRKIARYVKTHSHTLLPECDVSVWVDGNIVLNSNFISLIDKFYSSPYDFQSMQHPNRRYMYEEIRLCHRKKMDPRPIKFIDQKNFYVKERFPDRSGLMETKIVFRKTKEVIACLNDLWWTNINRFTVRDQCSLMFCLWKLKIKFNAINYSTVKKYIRQVKPPPRSTNMYGQPSEPRLSVKYYSISRPYSRR